MFERISVRFRVLDSRIDSRLWSDSPIGERPRESVLSDRYYDTPKDALNREGMSLRLRREQGRDTVVTLSRMNIIKDSGYLYAAKVWNARAESIESAAEELMRDGAPAHALIPHELSERCKLGLLRKYAVLMYEDMAAALLYDCGTLEAGSKSEPFCDLTMELLYGDTESFKNLASHYESEYNLEREMNDLYSRALRLVRTRQL